MKSANNGQIQRVIFTKQVQIVCDVRDIYDATLVVLNSFFRDMSNCLGESMTG